MIREMYMFTRNKKFCGISRLRTWLLVLALLLGQCVFVRAEEYQEEYYDETAEESYEVSEDEYIPETYYDPPRTNSIEGWPQGPLAQAEGAVVMDMDTGTVLYGKNMETNFFPASITKIMTALVAMDQAGDNLDQVIECPDEVYDLEEGASHLGFAPGEKLTLRQALYGLMLASANDLGNAIAVHIGGSIAGFADLMNEKAADLGCEHTHFTNPHGLHNDDHYTCALDMARIARAAYANPVFREICSTREGSIPKTNMEEETRYFLNHHKMLQKDSEYYQEWCTGGKTGFTSDAWNTLVTFGEKDDMKLVCVVLHEDGAYRSYEDTTQLMEYGFSSFVHMDLTKDISSPSFLHILGMDYPAPGIYRSDELSEGTVSVAVPGNVTVPADMNPDLISYAPSTGDGMIHYLYGGWPVGVGSLSFTSLPETSPLPYQQERDMEELLKETGSKKTVRELQETGERAWESIRQTAIKYYEKADAFISENQLMVLLLGALILLVVLILIVIIIRRCTRESRILKKRKAEEKARLRAEEEIARKSAVEIEEELREAMRAEEERRKRAERIAEEKRRAEEELREIEEIIQNSGKE